MFCLCFRYAKEMEEYRRKKAEGTFEPPPVKAPQKRGPRPKKKDDIIAANGASPSAISIHNKDDDGNESIGDASSDEVKDSIEEPEAEVDGDADSNSFEDDMHESSDENEMDSVVIKPDPDEDDDVSESIIFTKK